MFPVPDEVPIFVTARRDRRSTQAQSRGVRRAQPVFRRIAASAASLAVVVSTLIAPTAALAADTAGLTIQKSVTATTVVPGETFNWVIEVGCSVLEEECINAELIDIIPPEFDIDGPISITPPAPSPTGIVTTITPAAPPAAYDPAGPGQSVHIDFNMSLALPIGSVGLTNQIRTVTIPVKTRSDLPHSVVPVPVDNTAVLSADNAATNQDTASVSVSVPLHVATTATKTISPDTVLGVVGVPTTITVGGTNTSNSPVDSFTIQDPAGAVGDSGIFASTLQVNGLGDVTWPTGAETAVVSVWDAATATWVSSAPVTAPGTLSLPAAADAGDIRGVRIHFSSTTPTMSTGQTAGFQIETTVRAAGSGVRTNTSSSLVSVSGSDATATASDNLTLQAASATIVASKTIAPDRLSAIPYGGDDRTEATVTLGARNSGTVPLKTMVIAEPSNPADLSAANPLAPAHPGGGLTFQSLTTTTWPAGATAAEITYYYDDGTTSTDSTTTQNTLPAPEVAKRVTGFAATFTGASMPTNSQATIAFTVKTNPAQTESRVDVDNEITASGLSTLGTPVSDTAHDTAIIYGERLDLTTTKALTRASLLAAPGQQTTARLTTNISDYPESSTEAIQVIQYDPPASETGLNDWYTYFNAASLTLTSVPAGATLTVQYRDASNTWADVPGLVGITEPGSPHTISIPSSVRDAAHGIRIVWESASGFVPGSTLASNITYELRSTLRDSSDPLPNADLSGLLENCSSATGSISVPGSVDAQASSETPCPIADLIATATEPGDGPGNPRLYKQFRTVGTNGTTVQGTEKDVSTTRSSERTGVRLSWSTGGRTGITEMTITDAAVSSGAVDVADYSKGMYDAFNLVRINAINNSIDPYLQYDRVAIELYNSVSGIWETPTGINCTVVSPCNTFNGYNLTAAQQDLYIGARFIYTERPGRTSIDYPPGSGVAASTGNSRGITLVYAIRDALRSNPTFPVVNGPEYNTAVDSGNSVIRNDAHQLAEAASGNFTRTTNDVIQLQDANLAVDSTKTWTGGPVPIGNGPVPTSRVTLETTNQTPATTISELTVLEPNPDPVGVSPFEHFNLANIHSLAYPSGATSITIEVRDGTGTVILSATGTGTGSGAGSMNAARTTAYNWDTTHAAQLANAESLRVHYTGRMPVSAHATVVLDLSLRETERTSGLTITEVTVDNSTKGIIADVRYDTSSPVDNPTFYVAELSDNDEASIQLLDSSLAVGAVKSFTPASQPEGVRTPITMTLRGTPDGTQRVASLQLLDDRATFWNAFDFVSKGTVTLPTFSSPGAAAVLQVEVCTGRTFDEAGIDSTPDSSCADLGGSWQGAGTWLTQSQLDGGAFLPAGVNAADVQGLRLTVKRADDTQWENPHAPNVTINVSVQRRENLRSGGPVPSDYAEYEAAPGETQAGETTNAVTASVTGIWGATATDSATAEYAFVRLSTSVQVEKEPAGLRPPGSVIPYILTMTNTGQLPIVNPVITDRLPADGSGAQLIFPPDSVMQYNFQVTGGTSPTGYLSMPTGTYDDATPTVVAIDVTEDTVGPTEIEFTFPAGTAIGVGETVTISAFLYFRPGLSQGTLVTNTFDIVGDRILDACTAPAGKTATTVAGGFGCETSTTVRPDHAPALRAFISTRAETTAGVNYPGYADVDSQFTGGTNADCRAAQNSEGFSRPGCAPLTIPGQDSTWRLTVQNTGTTEIDRLVVATRLPAVGDYTIVSELQRNSRWEAAFNGSFTANFGPGSTVTYYTTATQPCEAVLNTPSDPAACGTNPATGWALLPIAGLPDPSIVTALQFVVDFESTSRFAPAQIATVEVGTTTVASVNVFTGAAGSDPLAVNSLSVSGITQPGSGGITRISALDYSRAILGLDTGSVTIEKEVTGPAASFVPGWGTNPGATTFNGQLQCTSLGEEFTRDFSFTISGGVITPTQAQIDDLPGGAECTATETAASGQTTYTASTVTVDPLVDPASLPNIDLTNDYQLTQFEVRKVVTAPATTIVPTDFEFEVTCTFLGVPVPLAATDASFQLDANGVKVISGIPVNSVCDIQETDNRGAELTVVDGATTVGGTVTEDQSTSTVTITGIQPQPATGPNVNWAEFDNRYESAGVVRIAKAFEGGGAAQFGSDPVLAKDFIIDIVCTLADTVQFDGTVTLNAANGWEESLPAGTSPGSECVFTEPDLNGADAVVFSPADTGPPADTATGIVTVPAVGELVTVTATNWFLTGSLAVTKEWVGDAGAVAKFGTDPSLSYEFTLECTRDGVDVVLPGGNTRTATASAPTATFTGIASGADCVLTETEWNGALSWRIVDASDNPVADGEFTVVIDPSILAEQAQGPLFVENEFRFAAASVEKLVDIYRTGTSAAGPFEVELICTLAGRSITALEPSVQTIVDGGTVTWTELAAGADCEIVETDNGGSLATYHRTTTATGDLTARVLGGTITLAPLRTLDDEPNHAQLINSWALPVTGGDADSWLFAPAALLVLVGAGGLALASRRSQRTGRHAA